MLWSIIVNHYLFNQLSMHLPKPPWRKHELQTFWMISGIMLVLLPSILMEIASAAWPLPLQTFGYVLYWFSPFIFPFGFISYADTALGTSVHQLVVLSFPITPPCVRQYHGVRLMFCGLQGPIITVLIFLTAWISWVLELKTWLSRQQLPIAVIFKGIDSDT